MVFNIIRQAYIWLRVFAGLSAKIFYGEAYPCIWKINIPHFFIFNHG